MLVFVVVLAMAGTGNPFIPRIFPRTKQDKIEDIGKQNALFNQFEKKQEELVKEVRDFEGKPSK